MVCQMNQSFEYKYIILNQDKVTQKWESGENRVMDLSENIEKRLSVNETFRKWFRIQETNDENRNNIEREIGRDSCQYCFYKKTIKF